MTLSCEHFWLKRFKCTKQSFSCLFLFSHRSSSSSSGISSSTTSGLSSSSTSSSTTTTKTVITTVVEDSVIDDQWGGCLTGGGVTFQPITFLHAGTKPNTSTWWGVFLFLASSLYRCFLLQIRAQSGWGKLYQSLGFCWENVTVGTKKCLSSTNKTQLNSLKMCRCSLFLVEVNKRSSFTWDQTDNSVFVGSY